MKRTDAHKPEPGHAPRSSQPFFDAKSAAAFFAPGQSVQRDPFFQPFSPSLSVPLQAKLTVGAVGDKYEQEADRVAATVVEQINRPAGPQGSDQPTVQRLGAEEEGKIGRSPDALQRVEQEEELQMKPIADTIQRMGPAEEDELQMKSDWLQRETDPEEEDELQMKPDLLQRETDPEEEDELQMKAAIAPQVTTQGGQVSLDLESAIQQARGSGHPIAENVRAPLEQAFGADFSGVRVHTNAKSDQLNQSIQAKAFTTGQDVFFRQGAYSPGSRSGQELMAHELTHVVQQNGKGNKYQQGPTSAFGSVQRKLIIARDNVSGKEDTQKEYDKMVIEMLETLVGGGKGYLDLDIGTGTVTIKGKENATVRERVGYQIIEEIIRSKETVTIKNQGMNPTQRNKPEEEAEVMEREKVGSEIDFSKDLKENELIAVSRNATITKEKTPLFILLGHELVHALRALRGTWRPMKETRAHKYGSSVGGGEDIKEEVAVEEYETVGMGESEAEWAVGETGMTENALRKENKLPRRVLYGPIEGVRYARSIERVVEDVEKKTTEVIEKNKKLENEYDSLSREGGFTKDGYRNEQTIDEYTKEVDALLLEIENLEKVSTELKGLRTDYANWAEENASSIGNGKAVARELREVRDLKAEKVEGYTKAIKSGLNKKKTALKSL